MIPSDLQVAARKRNWQLLRLKQAHLTLRGMVWSSLDQANADVLAANARHCIDEEWKAAKDRILTQQDKALPAQP